MPLVLRTQLSRLMTAGELDGNFTYLEALAASKAGLNTTNTFTEQQTFQKALVENVVSLGADSVINVSAGAVFKKTITSATTLSLTSVPPNGVSSFILEITNGGAFAVTWWGNIKWPAGTAPSLTAAGKDRIGFYTTDGGATWEASRLAADSK